MKPQEIIPLALKNGQATLFGETAEYCSLTRKQKRIERMIGKIRIEKVWMCWRLADHNLDSKLSVNEVLDLFLDFREATVRKLRKLGYVYTEDEENHSYYDKYSKRGTVLRF